MKIKKNKKVKEITITEKKKKLEKQINLELLEEDIKALQTTEGKYSIVSTPLSQRQLLKIVEKTPERYIKYREGRGGKIFAYVPGYYMKKVLNYIFGWLWNFDILDKGVINDEKGFPRHIWVQGKLTILHPKTFQPIIWKTQMGGAEVKYLKAGGIMDYANDLKGATTDALKKCASELGIASDVYGHDETENLKEIKEKPKNVIKEKNKSPFVDELNELGKSLNYTPERMNELVFKIGKARSIDNLTEQGFKDLKNHLLDMIAEGGNK